MVTQVAVVTELSNNNSTTAVTSSDNMRYYGEGMRKPEKRNRHRSSSSLPYGSKNFSKENSDRALFRRSSSLSLSTEFNHSTIETALGNSLQQELDCPLSPLPSTKVHKSEREVESPSIPKSNGNGKGIPWQWSKIRKGIKTRNLRSSPRRQSGADQKAKGKQLQDHISSSDEDSRDEYQSMIQGKESQGEAQSCLSTSLSHKYQPKHFHDVAGHEIIIKTLSNAIQKKKVAPLNLLHGPSGTGKTSVARIFAMALNCESPDIKPCWSCRGCSRSLYIMELCSGSRLSGFQRIRTLLQSTTFTDSLSGFKVFIIEECHSLTMEAWEEILDIAERGYDTKVVFLMITEDPNTMPRVVSSRCQKFSFPKLKDTDITLKLATIVSRENIGIERDALKLIVCKAVGSMREAENILDQLTLLGSRITSSMVQQIVGLAPHNKLLDLLTTALSADTIKTVRSTRELIACGVQPQTLLSQLASLITVILSGAAATITSSATSSDNRLLRNGSQLTNDQSQRLSHALKILVDTEKQLSSSGDHTTWVVSSLLQIASEEKSSTPSTSIVLPGNIPLSSDADDKFDAKRYQNTVRIDSGRISDLLHRSKSRIDRHSDARIPEQPKIINTHYQSTSSGSTYKSQICPCRKGRNELSLEQVGNMEEVWQNMLEKIQSGHVKEFLCQVKLASLTISSANAIVHLIFKKPEDKLAAQVSEGTISETLRNAFGCPVTVNMSLEPTEMEVLERPDISTIKRQVIDFRLSRQQQGPTFLPVSESQRTPGTGGVVMKRSKSQKNATDNSSRITRLQQIIEMSENRENYPLRIREENIARPQQVPPSPEIITPRNRVASAYPDSDQTVRDQTPVRGPRERACISKNSKPKHRWLSLSSIQQGDASVEPYSQDLLFENANPDREKMERANSKLRKCFSKNKEDQHFQHNNTKYKLNRSWSCTNIFCRERTATAQHELNQNKE